MMLFFIAWDINITRILTILLALFVCYVSISRPFWIPFHRNVTLVSRARLGFSFLFDYYANILRTFQVKDFLSSVVMLVSWIL